MKLAQYGSPDVHRLWLEKWSPADCYPQLQNKGGRTVAMELAENGSADVHRLWLKKWSPADCCPQLQDHNGYTMAMYLARHASADVLMLWLEKCVYVFGRLVDAGLIHSTVYCVCTSSWWRLFGCVWMKPGTQ